MRCETCGDDVPLDQLADHLGSHIAGLDETAEPVGNRVRDPVPAIMEGRPAPVPSDPDPAAVKAVHRKGDPPGRFGPA